MSSSHLDYPDPNLWGRIKASVFLFFIFNFWLFGVDPRHTETPRLGVKWEQQLPAYTTATAMPDPSHVCNLHHSSQPCPILNPLRGARDQTRVFLNTEPQWELQLNFFFLLYIFTFFLHTSLNYKCWKNLWNHYFTYKKNEVYRLLSFHL